MVVVRRCVKELDREYGEWIWGWIEFLEWGGQGIIGKVKKGWWINKVLTWDYRET